MGQIDVTEILLDPDLVQPLTLIKRTACTDSFGKNQLTESPVPVVGSVQPVSGNTLSRLPDEFRVQNVQSFWLKHEGVADSKNKYPDIILKCGVRFTVQVVFDWTSWGAGWTEGTCVQERPSL